MVPEHMVFTCTLHPAMPAEKFVVLSNCAFLSSNRLVLFVCVCVTLSQYWYVEAIPSSQYLHLCDGFDGTRYLLTESLQALQPQSPHTNCVSQWGNIVSTILSPCVAAVSTTIAGRIFVGMSMTEAAHRGLKKNVPREDLHSARSLYVQFVLELLAARALRSLCRIAAARRKLCAVLTACVVRTPDTRRL